MSTFDYFAVALVLAGIIAVLSTVVSHTLKFSVQVEPLIEWVVIRSLDGEIRALGAGTHSLQPGWKKVDRVPTSIQRTSETGEEVRTLNSVRLSLDEQLNFVAGHRMTLIPGTNDCFDVNQGTIEREMVIRASTSIDPGQPTQTASIREQVKLAVDAACEVVFGCYTDEEIFSPSRKKPSVPKTPILGMKPEKVDSVSELYIRLSECIKRTANRSLEKIGIGLTDLMITNLRYLDPELQKVAESDRRKVMIAKATRRMNKLSPEAAANLHHREQIMVGEPGFSEVAAAQAKADAVRAIGKGMENLANGIKDAVKELKKP